MSNKLCFTLIAFQSAIVVLVLLAILQFAGARDSYQAAAENQIRCERLAESIGRLRKMESVADEGTEKTMTSNQQIVQLARGCGIAEQQIGSIRPLVSEIENTDCQRVDLAIELKAVSMQQLVKLVLNFENRPGFKATSLSLSSARAQNPFRNRDTQQVGEVWNAQVTLTQLVFIATRSDR